MPALILSKEGCSLTPNVDFGLPLGCKKPCQCTPNLYIIPVINLVLLLKVLLHGGTMLAELEDKYFIRRVRKRVFIGISLLTSKLL